MDERFRFKPHLRVELAGDGMIFLIGEHERFLLSGRLYERLVPLLDGRRTVSEIAGILDDGGGSPSEVYYALTMLREKGYLVDVVPEAVAAPEAAAFWSALGYDSAPAVARLAATQVTVVATDGEDPAPMAAALAEAGVAVRDGASLRIVVTGDYLDRALEMWNRRALAERFLWMPVKPGGATPWVGPMFRPGEGPCWECLAERLRVNRPVETFLARRRGELVVAPRARVPASASTALDLAALTVAQRIASGGRGEVDDKLLELDLRRMRIEHHPVTRRPQCPACGAPDMSRERNPRPIVLASRPKRFTDDGGYRCATPEETYARYEHLVSPITGVVTHVRPVPERDHPLRPVYSAGFFVRLPLDGRPTLGELRRVTLGKGRTVAQARTGALCEAIERYSAVAQGDEPIVHARMSELGGAAVHPSALLNLSESQYRRREDWNRRARDRRQQIPPPFDPEIAIDWAPVWSLSTGERRYVPATYCYSGLPVPPHERFCDLDPNGHAAGNCLEEAILQGFFELVERDAVGIWWYSRSPRPRVDLQSFAEPYFTALEAHYRSMGHELWVLDVTTDLCIPAFVAVARSIGGERWSLGFGCHLEARLGVQRALTELNQLFEPGGTSRAPWGEAPLADESFLFPSSATVGPPRRRGDFTDPASTDLLEDVRTCVEHAARQGLETLVLDQTRADIGLSVVQVMVPGLRHIWPRLGPGRIQDIPVRLGWLSEPRAEEDLNPVPLYL